MGYFQMAKLLLKLEDFWGLGNWDLGFLNDLFFSLLPEPLFKDGRR